jgi:hypothetical protein
VDVFNGMRVKIVPYMWEMAALDPGTREVILSIPVMTSHDMEFARDRLYTVLTMMKRPFLIRMFRLMEEPYRERGVLMHDGVYEVGFRTMEEWEGFEWPQ